MPVKANWPEAIKPLLKKYKGKRHPLEYKNVYQLIVVVVLAAQDSDKHINQVAPKFFETFPDMKALSKATLELVMKEVAGIRNFAHKAQWLLEMAQQIKSDKNIPSTFEELTALPGIGRKTANVIMREWGKKPEGVIVDLHVVRVANRLGISSGTDPKKIEKQIMEALPQTQWDAGMAMSFLGREICRPKEPKCEICVMKKACAFYNANKMV